MSATLRVRAPASTANLGPGFDCAGVALELWNELEVSDGDGFEVHGEGEAELQGGERHLGVRAFRLLATDEGKRLVFRNRIPLARGLGSSAATIAVGFAAGALTAGTQIDPGRLLEIGLPLEGHPDNLAPALYGGACLSWRDGSDRPRAVRIAGDVPLAAIAVVPRDTVSTRAARAALPAQVAHADASHTAGRAALLGAALASGSRELLAHAFSDRLHEPYRGPLSPVYEPIRTELPAGAAGVTISGSGPTVIVWVDPPSSTRCAAELAERFPDATVLTLPVAVTGAARI